MLGDALERARRTCPSLADLPPLQDELTDHLGDVKALADDVERVAQGFLRADSLVALPVSGGGYAIVPVAAVRGLVRRSDLTGLDIDALGRWIVEAGAWGWQRRQVVQNLLGVPGPVQVLLGHAVPPAPLVRALGSAGARFTVALAVARAARDAKAVLDQGNPFRAYGDRGSNYVADQQQLWLDLAAVAFTGAPSPPTGAAVAVFATSWAFWASLDERRRLANRAVAAADRAQDHARAAIRDGVHGVTDVMRGWLDPTPAGPPGDRPFPVSPVVAFLDALDEGADTADTAGDVVAAGVRSTVRRGQHVVGGAVDAARRAGEQVVDTAKDAIDAGAAWAKEVWSRP